MRVGNRGEMWQTTVKIPYALHIENTKSGNSKVSYSRMLTEALKEKFYFDVETKDDLRKKLQFFAGKLQEMQSQMPMRERR